MGWLTFGTWGSEPVRSPHHSCSCSFLLWLAASTFVREMASSCPRIDSPGPLDQLCYLVCHHSCDLDSVPPVTDSGFTTGYHSVLPSDRPCGVIRFQVRFLGVYNSRNSSPISTSSPAVSVSLALCWGWTVPPRSWFLFPLGGCLGFRRSIFGVSLDVCLRLLLQSSGHSALDWL